MSFLPGTDPVQQFWLGDKEMGPTFWSEIVAYGGLAGKHWGWMWPGLEGSPVTLEFFEDTPKEVIDGALAVYEAHDPTKVAMT